MPLPVLYFLLGFLAFWALGTTGAVLVQRRRAIRGPQGSWKQGFDVGIGFSLNAIRRLPEALRATGQTTFHLHDVEVMVRRVVEEVTASSPRS